MPDPIATVRMSVTFAASDGPVHATVLVGEGQRGRWDMSLGAEPVADGREPERVGLGAADDLAGRSLAVDALVTDTNPATNRTSLRLTLEGGAEVRTWTLEHTVDRPGGSVFYALRVLFDPDAG